MFWVLGLLSLSFIGYAGYILYEAKQEQRVHEVELREGRHRINTV